MCPLWLRRLKISIDRDGRVRLPNHALDTDEEWWASALSDPRLRSKDTDGWQDRLDRHRGEELVITCSKCPRSARRKIDDLIVEFGPTCACYQAAARIIDEAGTCRFGKDCRLIYETTSKFRRPQR